MMARVTVTAQWGQRFHCLLLIAGLFMLARSAQAESHLKVGSDIKCTSSPSHLTDLMDQPPSANIRTRWDQTRHLGFETHATSCSPSARRDIRCLDLSIERDDRTVIGKTLQGNVVGTDASVMIDLDNTAQRADLVTGVTSDDKQQVENLLHKREADFLVTALGFERNVGQVDERVDFLARGSGYRVFLTEGDAVLQLGGSARGHVVRLHLVGARETPEAIGGTLLENKSNYLFGNQQLTNVANHREVWYPSVYDGIDLRYYGNRQQLEYDYIVHAFFDPSQIRLSFDGADAVYINQNGELVLILGDREIRFNAPYSYQDIHGQRQTVDSHYVLHDDGSVGFDLKAYDRSRKLVIDPILDYGSYLGGLGSESIASIDIDASGNIYLAGRTQSSDMPTTVGAYNDIYGGSADLYVAKITPNGNGISDLVFLTYLGGSDLEFGSVVKVDASGNVYVAGATKSVDFPTTIGAYKTTLGGAQDGFVAKLDATGSMLLYSTLIGGDVGSENVADMEIDSAGIAHIVGQTRSSDFPTVSAYDSTIAGTSDVYVAKFSADGSALLYGSYLGGSTGNDAGGNITIDAAGLMYVANYTLSADFPTTIGAYQIGLDGTQDATLTVLDPTAGPGGLVYSTFFGGSGNEGFSDVVVDVGGSVFLIGSTDSADLPTTSGAYDTTLNGADDLAIVKINPAGNGASDLVYSTYLGGPGDEDAANITLDASGDVHFVGTAEDGFPLVNPIQASHGGGSDDAIIGRFSLDGSGNNDLKFSTWLGGSASDRGYDIAVDSSGNAYVVGQTSSADHPTTAGAYDTTDNGGNDNFVAKLTAFHVLLVDTSIDISDGDTTSINALLADKGADGFISLREAIISANNTANGATPDEIRFGISTNDAGHFYYTDDGVSGQVSLGNITSTTAASDALLINPDPDFNKSWYTIALTDGLPPITEAVTIDGTTQPSFLGTPIIELDGSGASGGTEENLITVEGGNTILRGLVVNRFLGDDAIELDLLGQNTIVGNYIGTDVSGTIARGNDLGLNIHTGNNQVGGTTTANRNIISGNNLEGIRIDTSPSANNVVSGNHIGVDAMGTGNLGNGGHGIILSTSAQGNLIGGVVAGAGNIIAYNGGDGIYLDNAAGTSNQLLGNNIYANSGLGIDLGSNGVTTNNAGDGDSGPNNLQNFPVLDSAHTTGALAAIRGSLNSTAATTFRLEFFANTTADGSNHGEGQRYLGFREVITHAATGNAVFTFMLSASVAVGEFVTATATNLTTNDTSEFALNATALAGLDSDGDGVLDVAEDRNLDGDGDPSTGSAPDTDGDGTPDYLDPTDDGASDAATLAEDPNGNGDPTDDDTDGDGIPDYLDPDDSGPGFGDSDMDGVDDDVECPSGPFCPDTDGDGIPNYNDPDHNTLVQSLTLTATADTSGVWIEWRTGWEVDNLGFQVYREVNEQPLQVTPSLVAGSALLAGPETILPAGYSYAWHDPAGMVQDRYWLVDIDLDGQRTWHGPLQALPINPLARSSHRMPTPLLARLGQQRTRHTPARISPLRGTAKASPLTRVATPRQSPGWEVRDLSPAALQHTLATAPALILTVRESGWYRVSQAALIEAGLDPQIDPRQLQLFANGYPQPLHVIGESDGQLDPDDAIEFYGEGLDTAWSDTQAYWLVVGLQPGTRLSQMEALSQSPTSESFAFTVEQRERTVYVPAVQNGLDENFFGVVIAADPVDQTLYLTHLDPTPPSEAHLVVTLQGITTHAHQVRVRLNGQEIGVLTVSGRTRAIGEFALPQSQLQSGANLVTLSGSGADRDVSVVESIQLTYWRTYMAEDNVLRCTVPNQQSVSLSGFTTDDIRVFDITEPEATHELMGTITADRDGYRVSIAPQYPGERTLLAIGSDESKSPLELRANVASTWHRPDQGADLVIIAHRTFLNSVIPLQTLREQQGWAVARIDVQDLYDEWYFGHKNPQAISAFLQHAAAHWQTVPRFVLLVGDASFDPRDYLGEGPSDWIPTTWIRTAELETASDDALADLDGDGIADLAIGRLPVRSTSEADNVVAKLLAYDAAEGDWRGRSLVVTDRPDEFDFAGRRNP